MESERIRTVTWTPLELTELLEEENSCVRYERTKKHLALHPFYFINLQAAVNEILHSMLNTYDIQLKGFILACNNIKILTSLGEVFCDNSFTHIDIEADFYLFHPEVGCSLKGTVTKKGMDHIVILIHKTFPVSIARLDAEDWPGDSVDIGQEVRCHITHIDRNLKLPYIRATLNSDYLQGCRLPVVMSNIDKYNENNEIDVKPIVKIEKDAISVRDKKKKRKRHIDEDFTNDTEIDQKKHKKIKSKVSSDSESEISIKIKVEKPDPVINKSSNLK